MATQNNKGNVTTSQPSLRGTKQSASLIPKLRFKEFEGEWSSGSLKKIASVNPKTRELPDEFIYIDLESVTNGMLVKEESISKEEAPSRAQRVLDKNDILYQTVRPYQKNNLFFEKEGDYVASTGYAQIKSKGDSQYLFQFLHTDKFVNIVNRWSTGTSYPAISPSELVKISINFPNLPEQQKIANFLTAVDTKLQQLTTKKETLAQYKKGVMQQLFSQQLRFKDDDGSAFVDWEEKKLGEIFKFKQGFQFPVEEQFEEPFDESVYFIRIINVTSSPNDKRYVLKPEEHHVLSENDLFMVRYGDAGRIATGFNGIIANNMFRLLPKTKISNKWFYFYLDSIYEKIHALAGSSTMPAIKFGTIENLKVNTPSLKEQQKIANYLSAIDKKIEAVQTQITQTQAFKKGLLQQLFV